MYEGTTTIKSDILYTCNTTRQPCGSDKISKKEADLQTQVIIALTYGVVVIDEYLITS